MPRWVLAVVIDLMIKPVECRLVVVGDNLLEDYTFVSHEFLPPSLPTALPSLPRCDQGHSLSIHRACKLALFPDTW